MILLKREIIQFGSKTWRRDQPEQDVVELDVLGVGQLLHVFEGDDQLDWSLGLGQFSVEDGWHILQQERETEEHSIEVPHGSQDLALASDELEPLVPAVHRGLELDLVLVGLLLLLRELQSEDNN